jgi:hypothetical protein
MGRVQHSSFFSFDTKKCPCFRLGDLAKSCCEDEHELVKIEDSQYASQLIHPPSPEFNLIGKLFFESVEVLLPYSTLLQSIAKANSPPPKVPIYQAICSLVFYEAKV